jgi:hypothetical protein
MSAAGEECPCRMNTDNYIRCAVANADSFLMEINDDDNQKWVFHAIYFLAFLSLYGEHICSLNWLVIRDEEDAEYHSFETLILTHEMFWSSTVMLCTFHAIWQPFQRDIYHLLPSKKSQNGKLIELTEVGRAWGEYTWHLILFMILYNGTYLFFHDQ